MCINQQTVIPLGRSETQQVKVPCRYCWACLQNKENELAGKALLELQTAPSAWFITLTYDDRALNRIHGDTSRASKIHISDFQKFIKRLRKHGYNCRYIASAEQGTSFTKRTHFHAIIYWLGIPPQITTYWNGKPFLTTPQNVPLWPYGHVDIDRDVNVRNIRYVTKYTTKYRRQCRDIKMKLRHPDNLNHWVTYSKKPVLGAAGIIDHAISVASHGVWPQNRNFFPAGLKKNHRYQYSGAAEYLFVTTLMQACPTLDTEKVPEGFKGAVRRKLHIDATVRWSLASTKEQVENFLSLLRPRFSPLSEPLTYRQKLEESDAILASKHIFDMLQLWRKECEEWAEKTAIRLVASEYGYYPEVHNEHRLHRVQTLLGLLPPKVANRLELAADLRITLYPENYSKELALLERRKLAFLAKHQFPKVATRHLLGRRGASDGLKITALKEATLAPSSPTANERTTPDATFSNSLPTGDNSPRGYNDRPRGKPHRGKYYPRRSSRPNRSRRRHGL